MSIIILNVWAQCVLHQTKMAQKVGRGHVIGEDAQSVRFVRVPVTNKLYRYLCVWVTLFVASKNQVTKCKWQLDEVKYICKGIWERPQIFLSIYLCLCVFVMFVCAQTSVIWFVVTDGSLGKTWLCPWKEQRTCFILGRGICQSIKFCYRSVCRYVCVAWVPVRVYPVAVKCVRAGMGFLDHEWHCVMTKMYLYILSQ